MRLAAYIFWVGFGSLLGLMAWVIAYGLVNGSARLGAVEDIWARWFALSLLLCAVGGVGVMACEFARERQRKLKKRKS